MKDALQHALDVLSGFLAENPLVGAWYTTVVRFVFPLLALMILVGAIRSLWKALRPAMCSWNIRRSRASTPRSSVKMTAAGQCTT